MVNQKPSVKVFVKDPYINKMKNNMFVVIYQALSTHLIYDTFRLYVSEMV